MSITKSEDYLEDWSKRQGLAEKMIPLVGQLYRNHGIVSQVYGRRLMNVSTIEVVKAHRFARQLVGSELDITVSHQMLETMSKMNLSGPARVDLGKLQSKFIRDGEKDVDTFLAQELDPIADNGDAEKGCRDVVLYGFGRIGRLLARLLVERTGSGNKMRLRAVVVRGGREGDLKKRASLLRRDSVHGPFNGSIIIDEENNAIIANGNYIQFISANSPAEVDYTKYGISNALVVDNTGVWKDEAGLGQHTQCPGASKVLLTAPAAGEIKNIVYGINHKDIASDDTIVCAASCTTNAIVPPLKVLNDEFGIKSGHIETVHSYTNDQNLIDNFHKAERRGRSAPLNMVLTSTGAAKAVVKAVPELAGKLTGNAIRVPTPNVSMAVMNLNLDRTTTKEELNEFLRTVALSENLQDQLGYTESTELVSSDMVGSTHAGTVDAEATIVDGNRIVLYVWYDNEYGYSNQVIRVMQDMTDLKFLNIPENFEL